MPSLKETQNYFWKLSQAPDGVLKNFRKLQASGEIPLEHLQEIFVEKTRGEVDERLEIYAQMYFWRLFECIQEDYPATEALIGKENFHRLVVDYLQHHPSQFRDIALVGRHLPDLTKRHPLGPDGGRPYLPDLAALEWYQIEVSREADVPRLNREDLAKIPPEAWGSLRLQVIPACRILKTSWDLFTPWKKRVHENASLENFLFQSEDKIYLIWRKDYEIYIQEISKEECRLLEAMIPGIPFGELCNFLSEEDPERAALGINQYLQKWIGEKLLTWG